ncbi:hypothetical protein C8R46DRAFT_1295137 [Mycena filopes]|nr:hypothetical protein C8R46DRAFT_1295137 [Mycena filopes]
MPFRSIHSTCLQVMLGLRAADSPPASTSNFASLVFPTSDSAAEPTSGKSDVAKAVIEWLFVVIAVLLIACLLLRRMLGTRPSPTRAEHAHSRVEQIILADPSYFLYPAAAVYLPYPVPAHAPARMRSVRNNYNPALTPTLMRTRAADIGAGGRRANDDAEPELGLGDKDLLPAYDGAGRPPRYAVTAPGASGRTVEPAVEGEVRVEPVGGGVEGGVGDEVYF